MTLKVYKDTHTKFGEARGSRGRVINFNKNFNASVDADTNADTNVDANADANAWASSIPLTSTLLR